MLLDMKQEAQCVYTAHLSSKPYGFRKKKNYHESMGANEPHGVANFEPWELYVVMATSSNPISPKTLSSLFPNLMMFYTKFDQNWPTDFIYSEKQLKDIQILLTL